METQTFAVRVRPKFDGATIDEKRDTPRLSGQMADIYNLMSDGHYRTLHAICERVGASEAGASARLRDLRKPKFGGHTVHRRHICNGLHEYRLELNKQGAAL